MIRAALPALALLAACSPAGSFNGAITDGFSHEARVGVVVLAKSKDSTDMTCQVREAITDTAGKFSLVDLCANASYKLSLTDGSLMLDQVRTVVGGTVAEGSVDMVVWRAPPGKGVYRLGDDGLTSLRTFSDVATETILGSEHTVRYPTMKPAKVPAIVEGQHLVFGGPAMVKKLKVHPLVLDQGKRLFANNVSIEDHVYIGTRFKTDTEWVEESADLDASKVIVVNNGERQVKYISADALPQGRYAVLSDTDKRAYVFDFGAAPAANAKALAPE